MGKHQQAEQASWTDATTSGLTCETAAHARWLTPVGGCAKLLGIDCGCHRIASHRTVPPIRSGYYAGSDMVCQCGLQQGAAKSSSMQRKTGFISSQQLSSVALADYSL